MKCIAIILASIIASNQATIINTQCPSTYDSCKFKGEFDIAFTRKGAPECWGRLNDSWICDNKPTGKTCQYSDIGSGAIDVARCPGYNPADTCPSIYDSCMFKGEFNIPLTRKDAPQCWAWSNSKWICDNKPADGLCTSSDTGSIGFDVSKCPGYNKSNKCPSVNDSCMYKGEFNIPFTRMDAPKCWAWSNGKWICDNKPANGSCNSSDTGAAGFDVSSCPGYVHKLLG